LKVSARIYSSRLGEASISCDEFAINEIKKR